MLWKINILCWLQIQQIDVEEFINNAEESSTLCYIKREKKQEYWVVLTFCCEKVLKIINKKV